MTAFSESTEAWTKVWLDAQQQYMDTWLKLSRSQQMPWQIPTSPFSEAGSSPWLESFERWSKLFGQNMPGTAKDVSSRLFDLTKSYLGMSESFWKILQQSKDTADWVKEWQHMVRDGCAQLTKGYEMRAGANDPWSGFANLWGLPMSNWQRMACTFSPFPGEMEKALREGPGPAASAVTRHLPSVPSVGYTREWQEQWQDWTRLHTEYLHAVQDFAMLLGQVVQRALQMFGDRIKQKITDGETLESLRAIYDLWIDCGEDAYAEQVATAEFPHLQAEMVNALMRMKRQEQIMVEEVMTALNVPTRREIDTTHQRVYQLQRDMRALQEEAAERAEAEAARAEAPRDLAATPAPETVQPAARKKAAARASSGPAKRRAQPTSRKG
jgi:class III poly(R)-hydroxyalkanoic acid synthase PhaE subunit